MEIMCTKLNDMKIIEPTILKDERGFFYEAFRQDWFEKNCAKVTFIQENHLFSQKGTLRGLHFQMRQAQGKLIKVVSGDVFDVAVDLRKSSTTFGQWCGITLSSSSQQQLWLPAGFAHGFYVLSNTAEVIYKCTEYYHPESEVCIRYDDPTIAIDWPQKVQQNLILSAKDKNGLSFLNCEYYG